jgi:hypothetical protein
MEISLRIKDDPEAGQLLDQFLDACFDSVPPPDWAPAPAVARDPEANADRIAAALDQFNAYLKRHAILPEGLQPPRPIGLNTWAEEITMRVLTNGAY